MEAKLEEDSKRIPVGVLIPALFSDLSGKAMNSIIQVLSTINYLKRIYICLDRASEAEYGKALRIVDPLGDKCVVIWNDSPRIRELISTVEKELHVGIRGKGHAVWTGLGYIIGKGEVAALAFHDADILTYDREFLVRLLYPIVHLRYQFSKGYYVRFGSRFYARVTRLFYFPFIRALKDLFGYSAYLDYMGDFRYPLSGEFATFVSQAYMLQFPCDWGIEVGILGEIYRNITVNRICQVELTSRYDHKHQQVGDTAEQGLYKMASDIARTIFTLMSSDGIIIGHDAFNAIRHAYLKNAREFVRYYESYASMYDGLEYNLHEELKTVDVFSQSIDHAIESFYNNPKGSPMIPDWKRVESAVDNIFSKLVYAVENPSLLT
jgi:glucosyl-3-phosphoglycerate synthase